MVHMAEHLAASGIGHCQLIRCSDGSVVKMDIAFAINDLEVVGLNPG